MKNFKQPGKVITYANSSAVESGDMVQIGSLVGISCGKYKANEEGEYSLMGVYSIPSASATTLSIGDAVGYDVSAGEIVAQGNVDSDFDAGFAFKAKLNGETSVEVLLPLGGY